MKIGGLVEQRGLALYTVVSLPDRPGMAAKILKFFSEHQINLFYITESSAKDGSAILSFCVECDDIENVDRALQNYARESGVQVKKKEFVGIVGIYGPHFREKPAIASKFCTTLAEAGINILGISSSISTISCVIAVQDFETAKEAILKEFELP